MWGSYPDREPHVIFSLGEDRSKKPWTVSGVHGWPPPLFRQPLRQCRVARPPQAGTWTGAGCPAALHICSPVSPQLRADTLPGAARRAVAPDTHPSAGGEIASLPAAPLGVTGGCWIANQVAYPSREPKSRSFVAIGSMNPWLWLRCGQDFPPAPLTSDFSRRAYPGLAGVGMIPERQEAAKPLAYWAGTRVRPRGSTEVGRPVSAAA